MLRAVLVLSPSPNPSYPRPYRCFPRSVRRWLAHRSRSPIKQTSTLLGPLMACPRSYPFPSLPHLSFQSYKPTTLSASTCFASPTSLPRFLAAHGRSLGVLHLVSVTAPLRLWLRTRLHRAAWASSVTCSISTTALSSASWYVAFSVYPHPASSPFFAPSLLVLLAISRFKLCGVCIRVGGY
jgi:hypothetical protein